MSASNNILNSRRPMSQPLQRPQLPSAQQPRSQYGQQPQQFVRASMPPQGPPQNQQQHYPSLSQSYRPQQYPGYPQQYQPPPPSPQQYRPPTQQYQPPSQEPPQSGLESSNKDDPQEEVRKLKVALQEMGRVVKYLETELQKAQQASGSDTQELSGKLIQAQTKNQELEMKVAGMEKRTVESVRHVKAAAQNAINEKDKVIQEITAKLKKAEESLQMMDSGSMMSDSQNATIRDLEEKCRRLQANQQDAGNVVVKQYDAKLRTAQEQMVKLQQSLQAAKGREENGVKLMEEKLKASQNQISTLLKTLKGKEASWQTKDQENVRQFNEKMKAAQENISSLQASLKAKDEDDGRSKFYEEKSKLLEDNLKAKDYNLASLKEKLMQADRDSQEDKVRLGQMEQIVKSLEEKQVNTESKMKLAEQETKKLREERVMKERTVKENFKKMEIKIKSTDQAIALLEKKKNEAELNGQNAEAEKMKMEEEMMATREKMSKMEFDCSEALTKFRDLQERVSEADRRYLESEREGGELRKNCEEHLEQYEHAISNKTRYEYQINFLQEKLRRLSRNGGISSKTTVPAPTVISHISEGPDVLDVNEQFLSLLDMDAAGKYKEMEQKCVEMERRKMEAEEKLMEEMEKNSYYKITNDELKLGLKNIEDLQKENSELRLKVEEAVKSEMDMFMIDSAPIVDTNKVDVEKDIEILALKNELEDKKQLVEKEARLMKEVDYLKSIEKELCEKEDSYQRELEILRMENLRISHQLTSLKGKNKAEDFGTEDAGSDDELFSKYESELVELKLKNSALLKENSEINKLLTEKDNELHELLENEDEMNKTIAEDKTLKGSTKEEGDLKVASELQRTKEQNLSQLEEESEVSFELLPEQQEILTQISRKRKSDSEDLIQVKKIRIEQSVVTETTEDEGSVELGLDANDEQEDEPGFMSDTSEGTVEDQVCGDVSDVHTISNNLDFHGQNLAVDNEAIEDLSPLVDAATETVETDAESVTADAEFDVDAESVAGAENTESVAGSVGGYMETGSMGDVNTTVTGDAETESVGSDVTDDAEADSIGSDTEAESVGGEMDTESVEDAAETKSLAGDFDPESTNNDVETKSVAGDVETESVAEAGSIGSDVEDESVPDDADEESVGDDAEGDSISDNSDNESVAGYLEPASVDDDSETESVKGDENGLMNNSSTISTEGLLVSTPPPRGPPGPPIKNIIGELGKPASDLFSGLNKGGENQNLDDQGESNEEDEDGSDDDDEEDMGEFEAPETQDALFSTLEDAVC